MNIIKKWWKNYQAKNEQEITESIKNEFKVVEKSGCLFLTHDGVAFEQIDSDTPANIIAEKLNIARETAGNYRVL